MGKAGRVVEAAEAVGTWVHHRVDHALHSDVTVLHETIDSDLLSGKWCLGDELVCWYPSVTVAGEQLLVRLERGQQTQPGDSVKPQYRTQFVGMASELGPGGCAALHGFDEDREGQYAKLGSARVKWLVGRGCLGNDGSVYLPTVVLVSHEHDVA
jgi:hypothetical protein